jgi:hypothetical protein
LSSEKETEVSKRTRGEHSDFGVFPMYKVASEYAKSILECTEITSKEYKHLKGIRQEYFAVHADNPDRHKIHPL